MGDHFQCYRLEKGDRVKPQTIYIKDQFGGTKAVLGRPVMLCNPSFKVHNGKEYPVRDKKRHLVCYNYVKQERPRSQSLYINTQFGADKVISTRRELFCAPAGKAHLPGRGEPPRPTFPGKPIKMETKPIKRP
ncbi:MAG TPA: hypothetical protein ENK01_00230 [Hellea balneolensis]|uniref:DUF7450 domain-containing protein n=1 Tax=Hellea balneolensis TaxID=287478 RepID=A0A7V5NW41_9PROT|nr:hypothetical protein [Hellea balneolensis]